MKDAARYLILGFAVLAVIAILVMWKRQDRASALDELKNRYEADVVYTGEELTIGCASERLVDLIDFADVVARAGEPAILDLTGAPNLESFAGVEKLLGLESLIAIDCPKLVSAEGVSRHPGLKELVFTDSRNLTDASAIQNLPALETLDLSGCEELGSIDVSQLPSLRNLYLSRCRNLTSLDVSQVPDLKQLYLDGCAAVESVAGLGVLSSLTDLDVSNATSLTSLEGISGLNSLVVLDIRNVELSDFSEIGKLQSLRVLRMGGHSALETLEPFAGLTELREIHLEACVNFHSIKGIPATVSQYAGFTHCPKLTSIEGIEKASGLEQLDLTGCDNLTGIDPVAELRNLVQLSLVKCRKVQDIAPAASLEKLVIVMLGGSGVVPAAVEKLEPANKEIIFDFAVPE
jgi:internalin A